MMATGGMFGAQVEGPVDSPKHPLAIGRPVMAFTARISLIDGDSVG
ncbi:hypothetical protein IFT47_07910 [Pseudomonas sp. CFBP 13711]|jgi:hypothetical protein|nr:MULTISPECIES: hypothetical protein [unclassified Pseudomonas]MBD8706556.1 hypothetical protein [Pseudomonas sp. CFBP 13711]MBD8712530.1 hypothetical protein [Pseudomonas sp. CFBP 13715]